MTHRGSAMTISATSSTPAWNELFRVKFSRKQNDSSTEASTASGQANLPSLRRCNAFRGKKLLERNEDVGPECEKVTPSPVQLFIESDLINLAAQVICENVE